MPYCAYLRKSRADLEAEAHGEGETLARHERMLQEAAKRMQLSIAVVYREIVSGESIADRPTMQQLLREVERSMWEGVFVVEVERLARGDTVDQGLVSRAFLCSHTKIVTPLKTYDPANEFDEEYFEFGLFMSRREYQTIRRRMIAGCQSAAKEGKYAAKQAPFGYRRVKLQAEKGWTLEIHEGEAQIVREIYRLYLAGNGYQRIAALLIAQGIVSPQKGKWSAFSVRRILHNVVYIGKIRWGERPVKKSVVNGEFFKSRPYTDGYIEACGRHEAIIAEEVFQAVQNRLRKVPAAPIPQGRQMRNPLQRILRCSQCGHAMQLHPYPQLDTASLECRTVRCPTVSARLPVVEQAVRQAVTTWFAGYEVWVMPQQEDIQQACQAQRQTVERMQKELLTLARQQLRAQELVEQGIYTVVQFLERRKTLEQKQTALQAALCVQEETLAALSQEMLQPCVPYPASLPQAYQAGDIQEQNTLLRGLVEKMVYARQTRTDSVKLQIFPLFPPAGEEVQQL